MDITFIRFHVDLSTDVTSDELIHYFSSINLVHFILVKEEGSDDEYFNTKAKPHWQGILCTSEVGISGTKFRNRIKNKNPFKQKLKGCGKFSFSDSWGTNLVDNKYSHKDWFYFYLSKENNLIYSYQIDYNIKEHFQEYNRIKNLKKDKKELKAKMSQKSKNEQLIEFVKIQKPFLSKEPFSSDLHPHEYASLITSFFSLSNQDFEFMVVRRKTNMLINHFYPDIARESVGQLMSELLLEYGNKYKF